MAQKKGTKNIKVRDLKPKKDAKGGFQFTSPHQQQGPSKNPTGPGHGVTRPGQGNT
jgi:hypothetical protein